MQILVTGATGFLGGHLVELLRAAGAAVRAWVRPTSDATRLRALGVTLVGGDAADGAALRRAAEGADLVFHLAGYVSAAAPFTTPAAASAAARRRTQAVNVDFTAALLAACLDAGVGRFVYASSSSVYSLDAPAPTPEEAPCAPFSLYGRSKLQAEAHVQAAQARGLSTVSVRPAVIYGPRDRAFTPAMLRLARLPVLPLLNGGRTLLDLVYVGDVVDLLWRAARCPAADGRVYNAGPGRPYALRDFFAAYGRLRGRAPRIVPIDPALAARLTAPLRPIAGLIMPEARAALSPAGLALLSHDIHLDVTRAARELDFWPRFDLDAGLAATLRAPKN